MRSYYLRGSRRLQSQLQFRIEKLSSLSLRIIHKSPAWKVSLIEVKLTPGLFDEILPSGYRACELYARNLVEGWMSVGDECLKFMQDDYWTQVSEEL